jgi:hypothetical protein
MVGGALSQVLKTIIFGCPCPWDRKMRFLAARPSPKDLEFVHPAVMRARSNPIDRAYLLPTADAVITFSWVMPAVKWLYRGSIEPLTSYS